MNLSVFSTYDELSRISAWQIVEAVRAKPDAVLCLATGDTPRLAYAYVVELAKKNKVDFSRVHFVSLDEWVGIPKTNTGSCYFFLNESVFKPLSIQPEKIHFFDVLANDLKMECDRINKKITELNGIDLMVVGVGLNGHLGFNEPGASQDLLAHVSELDAVTRQTGQKYFSEKTELQKGITLGLAQLMSTKKLLMLANGPKKSGVMKRALEESISTNVPASLIRMHPDCYVYLDQEAAADLAFNK